MPVAALSLETKEKIDRAIHAIRTSVEPAAAHKAAEAYFWSHPDLLDFLTDDRLSGLVTIERKDNIFNHTFAEGAKAKRKELMKADREAAKTQRAAGKGSKVGKSGWSVADTKAAYEAQNGCCAISGECLPNGKLRKDSAPAYEGGVRRGLLSVPAMALIRAAREVPGHTEEEALEDALEYVRKYQPKGEVGEVEETEKAAA